MKEYAEWTVEVWNEYLGALPCSPSQELMQHRHIYAQLDASLAELMREAIIAAPEIPYTLKAPRVAWSPLAGGEVAQLLERHTYKALDARTRWHLSGVLKALKHAVARAIGAPWRVLQVRSWLSRPGAGGGPYELHTDGEPQRMLKIMCYWTPMGVEYGGFEIDCGGDKEAAIVGPAGTWVLFLNSALMHRAVAPQAGVRVATEITLCPWHDFDLTARFLGANVRHPLFPLENGRDVL